jgi:hypothetical protein
LDNKKLKNHLLNLINQYIILFDINNKKQDPQFEQDKQVCEGDVKDVLDKEKTKEHIYGIYVYINGNKK